MIKKFDNFINEKYYDSKKFTTLEPDEIVDVIESIKPGKPVLFRCHWAVSRYAIPNYCKKVCAHNNLELVEIDCPTILPNEVENLLSEPGKLYLLKNIHRIERGDVIKSVFQQLFNSDKSSVFVATTTTYKNDDEDFLNDVGKLLDKFYGIYQID